MRSEATARAEASGTPPARDERAQGERTGHTPGRPGAKFGPRGHDRWRTRAEDGVWATLVALGAAFLLAAVLGMPSPLEPVTELIVRLTPVAVATALIAALGGLARAFALLGALAFTLPFGIALALLAPELSAVEPTRIATPAATGQQGPAEEPTPRGARPQPQIPPAGAGDEATASAAPAFPSAFSVPLRWLAVAALSLVLALPLAAAADYSREAAASVVLGACYAPALWLVRRCRAQRGWRGERAASGRTSRRTFLRAVAGGGVRVAAFFALGSYDLWSGAVGELLGRGEAVRRFFAFAPLGARAPGFPVPGEEPEVTPVSAFYRMSKNDVDPWITPDEWALRIDGAVARPLMLRYDELLALPRTDEYVTLRCVSNPVEGHLMSSAYFSGVPLARLLAGASVRPDAGAVMLHAPDGYGESLPLAVALDPRTLAAYGINGETLPRAHGGPVRALIPGYYGFKNVKWLTGVSVLSRPKAGFWERDGWDAASVHSVARIDVTRRLAGGDLLVAGVAYTGVRGVSAVQVRVDGGGSWQTAELNVPPLSAMTWVQWRTTLTLAPGGHTLAARVVDGSSQPQDSHPTGIFPGGARGLDTVTVTI